MALERSDRLRLLEIAAMTDIDPEDLIPFAQELERFVVEGDKYTAPWQRTSDEEATTSGKKQH